MSDASEADTRTKEETGHQMVHAPLQVFMDEDRFRSMVVHKRKGTKSVITGISGRTLNVWDEKGKKHTMRCPGNDLVMTDDHWPAGTYRALLGQHEVRVVALSVEARAEDQ